MQYPYVHKLNAIWNDHTMVAKLAIVTNENKESNSHVISQTPSKWIKNHNDKTQDDQDV